MRGGHVLEIVRSPVLRTIALKSDLNTPEYHLFTTSEVNAQLNDISILYRVESRLHVGLAESDVVQKGAR